MIRYAPQGFPDAKAEADFMTRLNETIAWCRPQGAGANPRAALRQFPKQDWSDLDDRDSRVRAVIRWRSNALRPLRHVQSATPPEALGGGRLLVYMPDANLSDGVAEASTDGWFDVNNIPPHDTWIDMVAGSDPSRGKWDFLVSWVPAAFVDLVGQGIHDNPEQCILWARDLDHPLTNALRARGLTG